MRPTPAPSSSPFESAGPDSTPWQLVRVDGSDITSRHVAGSGRSTFRGIRVKESADDVELWTTVRTDRTAQACAPSLVTGSSVVGLRSVQGSRTLLHASVSSDRLVSVDDF